MAEPAAGGGVPEVSGCDVAVAGVGEAVAAGREVAVEVAVGWVAFVGDVAVDMDVAVCEGALTGPPDTVTVPEVAATLVSVPLEPPLLPASCCKVTWTVLVPAPIAFQEMENSEQLELLPQPLPSWNPATRSVPPTLSIGGTGKTVQPGLRVMELAVATAGLNATVISKPLTESLLAMEAVILVLAVCPIDAFAVPT